MAFRILIVDDHGVLRAGLRALLNTEVDFKVVGEASDGEQALRLAQNLQPDIILMDISMPGPDGIQITQQITEKVPGARVLILTVHEDKSLLQAAIRSGASGYILKQAVESELVNAIRSVARGDLYIYSSLTRSLLNGFGGGKYTEKPFSEALTSREVEVLRLIARGHTGSQIAEMLMISVRTVETHRANLMDKLDLHSRAELVHYAVQHGLLEVP